MRSCERELIRKGNGHARAFTVQEPQDGDSRQMLQTLAAFAPLLQHVLPRDPDQLDSLLERLAGYALMCRSDDAAPMVVEVCEKAPH